MMIMADDDEHFPSIFYVFVLTRAMLSCAMPGEKFPLSSLFARYSERRSFFCVSLPFLPYIPLLLYPFMFNAICRETDVDDVREELRFIVLRGG